MAGDVDYVDWCTHVFTALLRASDNPQTRSFGMDFYFIARLIPPANDGVWGSQNDIADALTALQSVELVEQRNGSFFHVTGKGRLFGTDLIPLWRDICMIPLDEQSAAVVRTAARLDPMRGSVQFEAICEELGESFDVSLLFALLREPELANMAKAPRVFGDYSLTLTYRGMVWATRRDLTIEREAVDKLIAGWETTSVEFKRELHTNTKDQQAELIKDLIGLANTQASGQRWMIVGFDDETRTYSAPLDKKITQNHLEQLIAAYIQPNLSVSWKVVQYHGGDVGMLEVLREPHKVPYRVSASIGDKTTKKRITEGQCFVRHGSQTEEPTPLELAAIEQEAARAAKHQD